MQVHITRSEVLALLLEKMPTNPMAIESVIITDGCDEFVPPDAVNLNKLTDDNTTISVGNGRKIDSEDPILLVKLSGIVDTLKTQLTDQGFASKIPKDAEQKCITAWETLIDKLSVEERELVSRFIGDCQWIEFSSIWDKYQNLIRKSI